MQLADGSAIHRQRIEDVARDSLLRLRQRAEPLRDAIFRRAEIANAAWPLSIRNVPEVTHKARHPAVIALRKPDHGLDLAAFLFALGDIRIAPLIAVPIRPADLVHRIDSRSAVRP